MWNNDDTLSCIWTWRKDPKAEHMLPLEARKGKEADDAFRRHLPYQHLDFSPIILIFSL